MKKEPKLLFKFMKRADTLQNRIVLPKFVIDNYGRDFYLEIYEDGTMKLIPITKLNKKEEEE